MVTDILFSTIERWHSMKAQSWGRFLDAGTGQHSLKWIQQLSTSSWTAITADHAMKSQITSDPSLKIRSCDSILVGNWMDPKFTESLGKFDTILADYLIGAIDGFSPYNQDLVISKLREHLNPGGKLYIVGMNPIPDHASPPADIVSEIRRVRDSCILLAGHRPYREYPIEWVTRQVERSGMRVIRSKSFTILHSEDSMLRQLRVAQSKLQLMPNIALKQGIQVYLQDLGERIQTVVRNVDGGRIPLSFDYIIAAGLEESYNEGEEGSLNNSTGAITAAQSPTSDNATT